MRIYSPLVSVGTITSAHKLALLIILVIFFCQASTFIVLSTVLGVIPFTNLLENRTSLIYNPLELSLTVGQSKTVLLSSSRPLRTNVQLKLKSNSAFDATPHIVFLNATEGNASIIVTGQAIRSLAILEIEECHYADSFYECPFGNVNHTFVAVSIVHSSALSIAVIVVGWLYFFAWSISFYPQIFLNFRRKSVVGLSFDFLLLNVIGFSCYTLYNVLMYFDDNIQEMYRELHPHSLSPVLLNDVVFAAHALAACIITALQCFFYERGKQRISYTCMGISSVFVVFALVSLTLTVFQMINALEFIMFLSYIKMAVTLSKYFPQAFFNFRRKSTVGWSIGNVILDLSGGSMDICQMILQALNTDDWSAFSGNPVKFGLGLVSIMFDIVFIIQHYVLYRNHNLQPVRSYDDIGTQSAGVPSNMSDDAEYGSTVPIRPASDSGSS